MRNVIAAIREYVRTGNSHPDIYRHAGGKVREAVSADLAELERRGHLTRRMEGQDTIYEVIA